MPKLGQWKEREKEKGQGQEGGGGEGVLILIKIVAVYSSVQHLKRKRLLSQSQYTIIIHSLSNVSAKVKADSFIRQHQEPVDEDRIVVSLSVLVLVCADEKAPVVVTADPPRDLQREGN